MLLTAVLIVLLLVVLNGVFAMSEMAVVSSKRTKLQVRADRGDKGAAAALKLSDDPTRFLSAVQVGITLIGILAGAFGQATIAGELDTMLEGIPAIAPYSEAVATGVVVVLLTYFSLILGELAPKRIALIHPEAIAAVVARPLNLMAKVMSPFVTLLTASTAGVLKILGIKHKRGESITQEEVETVLAEGTGAGVIEPEEQLMIHEVMRLGDRHVRVAMTPRPEVYWISLDDPVETIRAKIAECPYSRFVVARGANFDSSLGVVLKRDVADTLLKGESLDVAALVRDPLFIPETTTLLDAMGLFKTSPSHFAFIVDEFGGLEGIITPTDILEMIAGDFPESHDTERALITKRDDGSFLVDGRADLLELGDALDDDFETAGFHTVAGLILEKLGRFPSEGEVVPIGRFDVEIIDMDERRIDKAIFRKRKRS